MRVDKENLFSDAQAVTATAISANVIDTAVTLKDLGAGGAPIYLWVSVDENFATATSVTITLESDSAVGLGSSPVVHYSSGAIAIAGLTAGTVVARIQLPEGATYKRYLGMRYTIGGSNATAGKFTAFLTGNVPAFYGYANAYDNYTGR